MLPLLIVGGLVVAVIYAANNRALGPAGTVASIPGVADAVPGGGLSGPISPAMAGGQPTNSADNMLRLAVNTKLPVNGGNLGYMTNYRDIIATAGVAGTVTPAPQVGLPSAQPTVRPAFAMPSVGQFYRKI